MTPNPIIKDPNGEFSGPCCPPTPGIKELHRIHRTLPRRHLHNCDPEVLQDEAGLAILDELTAGFIYDDLRAGGTMECIPTPLPPEIFSLPETSPLCSPGILVHRSVCSPEPCAPCAPRNSVIICPCPPQCPPGPVGPPGPPGTSTVEEIIATEDLFAFSVIIATGKRADSSNISHQGLVVGITLGTILSGAAGQFVSEGSVENLDWSWAPGDRLYLNGMDISTIPPVTGFSQQVATAETSTVIFFDLVVPVLL